MPSALIGGGGQVPGAGALGGYGGYNPYPAGAGDVKRLPFQKTTTSTPNMGMLDPAMQQRLGYIAGMTPPNYTNYFNQLSDIAYRDASRRTGQMSGQYGGNPTATLDQGGGATAALQALMYQELNDKNVQRYMDMENSWRQMQAQGGLGAYSDYFGAIANRAYNTSEDGYQSQIYNPPSANFPGGVYNPYINSNFPTYDSPGGAGGAGGTGGGGMSAGPSNTGSARQGSGSVGGSGGGMEGPGTYDPNKPGVVPQNYFTSGPMTWKPTPYLSDAEEPGAGLFLGYDNPGVKAWGGEDLYGKGRLPAGNQPYSGAAPTGSGSMTDLAYASGAQGFVGMQNGKPVFRTRADAMASGIPGAVGQVL